MYEKKFKWLLEKDEKNNVFRYLNVKFAYGWEEIKENDSITGYEGQYRDEMLEIPVNMDDKNIPVWLDLYWANRYGAVDANYTMFKNIKPLQGSMGEY